jgi:tRNA (adenine22-N1)-methyltransferase
MQLSRRLKAVADTVTIGNRVADVGCDHAYISIYLIKNDIAPKVIAMDVNKGPLKKAAENINNHGYSEHIQTRLSDGLHQLEPGEADTILIAGMGGALVIKILEEGPMAVHKSTELILQPQSEIFLVRKFLHQIGFCINQEQMVKEDGKFYFIIKAEAGIGESYDQEVFYQYSKLLLEQSEPLMKEYLDRERRIRNEVIKELKANPTEKAKVRLEEVNQDMAYIDEALSYFK